MWIYAKLCLFLPPILARMLTGLWFAILMMLVYFFFVEPSAEFRYGNI